VKEFISIIKFFDFLNWLFKNLMCCCLVEPWQFNIIIIIAMKLTYRKHLRVKIRKDIEERKMRKKEEREIDKKVKK
jgi:hypothetical protein